MQLADLLAWDAPVTDSEMETLRKVAAVIKRENYFGEKMWEKDKSLEFYKGMFAASRLLGCIIQSASSLDDANQQNTIVQFDLSVIITEKSSQ